MARYTDTPVNAATAKIKRSRAAAQLRVVQLEQNINAFIAAVEEVTFNVAAKDSEPWMDNWQANLLSGEIT